ncbi:MAG TPA: exodeoxyribonuclease III [Spirochaetia bacterium]|nr:exodeoxyribonuclease III [Spirochaetia bacterium]
MTRVFSWNVNGIRACAGKGLFDWLAVASPDILCLQETKAHPEQLPKEFLAPADGRGGTYRSYWASAKRRGYSGTAIYSKREPRAISFLGEGEFDEEGRALVADFGAFTLVSAYFPNSQDGGARLDYKLRFCAAILALCDRIVARGGHVVVAGDYNIAHKPIDLANPKANEGNPGYLPEERAWMDEFTSRGYVDSLRRFDPEPGRYTWWTYRVPGARERNVGWRLDYHCVDPGLAPALAGAAIHPSVLGSDHCPVSIDLQE